MIHKTLKMILGKSCLTWKVSFRLHRDDFPFLDTEHEANTPYWFVDISSVINDQTHHFMYGASFAADAFTI